MMIPSEYMIEELKRRDIVLNSSLGKVCEILQSATEGMTIDQMQSMIFDIRSALKGDMAKCGGCIRACVSMLEKKGGCMEGRFQEPLRTKKAWRLDR